MDCPGCKQPRGTGGVRFVAKWAELTEGAAGECPRCMFCVAFVECIRRQRQTTRQLQKITVRPGERGLILLNGLSNPGENGIIVEIFRVEGRGENPLGITRVRRRLPPNTGHPETIGIVRPWIEECDLLHDTCKLRRQRPPFSPKRLLDLRDDRVVLREGLNPTKYACLSHCWGANAYSTITKTLSDNVDIFRSEGVPRDALTKTFREAVSVCRSLGIWHLWIDSFCIIQDSPEDWRDQAAQMADIYENAFLTIAASWAPDGSHGLFSDVPPMYHGYEVPGYPDVYVREAIADMPSSSTTSEGSRDWPLLRRGWVYQEMRLSPRILHFGRIEVLWRCVCARKNNSGHNATVADFQGNPNGFEKFTPPAYEELGREDPVRLWHQSIEDYSGLLLTFETDRMIALAAVTQRMHHLRGGQDRYLAGLWESSLVRDLNWMAVPAIERPTPKNRAFPSWSWASIATWVMYLMDTEPAFVSVKEVRYQPVGPDYLGEFTEARITLEGPVIDCSHNMARFAGQNLWAADRWTVTGEIEVIKYIPDYCWDGPTAMPDGFDGGNGWAYIIPIGVRRKDTTFCAIYVRRKGDFYERLGMVNIGIVGGEGLTADAHADRVVAAVEGLPRDSVSIV
ncbi:heterokaryon incompatibility protein-domain-containing protein, partial [Echria macrotheca]